MCSHKGTQKIRYKLIFNIYLLEIDSTVVAEFVFGLAYEDFLACEVIGLLLFVQRQLAPVFEALDGAVGIVP